MTGEEKTLSSVQKLIVSEVLIGIVLVFSLIAFNALYAQKPVVSQKEIETANLNVDVFSVQPANIEEVLTGFGTARADREVILAAQVSGEIVEINPQLKIGYAVAADQSLASPDNPSRPQEADRLLKIDAREFEQRLEQATNRIAETETEVERLKVQQTNYSRQLGKAKSVLETLKEEYERVQKAVSLKAASASDLNRALLDLRRYEDTVIQLENQVASIPHQIAATDQRLLTSKSEKSRASDDLSKTDIYPPFAGVLSDVLVEQGQYVRAGEPLVRLTSMDLVEVPISLSFDDFLQLDRILTTGRKPKVSLAENETAKPRWSGFVVRTSPEANSETRTVEVFVEIDNNDHTAPLLPGAFVHARIEGTQHVQKIMAPREAIVDGQVYVVDKEGITHRKQVSLGRRLQSLVIIEDGLSEGDQIVMTNLDIVEDGRSVVVQSVHSIEDEISALRSPEIRLLNPADQ